MSEPGQVLSTFFTRVEQGYYNSIEKINHPETIARAEARERDVYKAERDTLAAQVKRAEAMIQLIDRHVGGADQTCDEPGISISEAARRTLRDQGHPLFQEDAANA